MAIAFEYKPKIAWRTIAKSVRLSEKETEETPAIYRLKVSPVDRHEIGAGVVDNECYFISFMGNPYTVTDANPDFIDVRDDFRVGVAPTSNKTGIIYKSVDGVPFIAPVYYRYLHNTAMDNLKRIELSILWQYSQLLNAKWIPKGLMFSFDLDTNVLSHTAGELNVANWNAQNPEKRFDLDVVEIDTTPVNKPFSVEATDYPITTPDAYYIYALIPLDKLVNNFVFRVNKEYWREKMFNGYITILFGILNSEADNRKLVLNWCVEQPDNPIEWQSFEYRDIIAGTVCSYCLLLDSPVPFNLLAIVLECDNGTLTEVAIKINTTAITGMSSIIIDTAKDMTTASGANAVAVHDAINLIIGTGHTGAPTAIKGLITYQRT